MKNKILIFVLIIFVAITISSCGISTDEFINIIDINNEVHKIPFKENHDDKKVDLFSKDIAVISTDENKGDDSNIGADASLLIDLENNEAIYANNVYDKLYPASLTKIATALVVLNHGELVDFVTISHNAANITEPGAKLCGFQEGDIITLDTLLYSFLIYSGNDAGIAIAEHIAGSEEEFVKLMNKEVLELGARHSNFTNSHGLHDDNHYSTAYDMYLIFNELIKHDQFVEIINLGSYTASYKNRDGAEIVKSFETTNGYLTGEYATVDDMAIVGGKTGTTNKAGSCLILLSNDKENKKYISIILNAESRTSLYEQMNYLLLKVSKN